MSKDFDFGTLIFIAIAALIAWSVYQAFTNPTEPYKPSPGEVCDYYDADPTQWTDMVLECYTP